MRKPLYLDYAATTPVDPRVAEMMCQCLTLDGNFGNPASRSHYYGWKAEEAVENARSQVAELIGADPREIVWTSGATESNNLAIKGLAQARSGVGRHIVTAQTEHKAVLDTCTYLASQGYEVTMLVPTADGLIHADALAEVLRDDTVLVSLMHVNNETGVLTDLATISALCRARGIPLHVDAAQSVGKVPVDVGALGVDLLSLSGHKMYGPKGIGALYVRRSADWRPAAQIHGGGHERGMRSGTLATHQVVGLGAAAAIAGTDLETEAARILALRNRFLQGVQTLPDVQLNGCLQQRVAGTVNLSFAGVDGESLLLALRELAISTGSACTSASVEPSYVLKAMGLSDAMAHSALRFSFGRFTSEQDVDFAINKVCSVVSQMRRSPGPATARPLVGAP